MASAATPFVADADVDVAIDVAADVGAGACAGDAAAAVAAFASLSCRVTDPSVPTEALHINTRGALLRLVNGRCMLLGTDQSEAAFAFGAASHGAYDEC